MSATRLAAATSSFAEIVRALHGTLMTADVAAALAETGNQYREVVLRGACEIRVKLLERGSRHHVA
jgi:hypothetical protein